MVFKSVAVPEKKELLSALDRLGPPTFEDICGWCRGFATLFQYDHGISEEMKMELTQPETKKLGDYSDALLNLLFSEGVAHMSPDSLLLVINALKVVADRQLSRRVSHTMGASQKANKSSANSHVKKKRADNDAMLLRTYMRYWQVLGSVITRMGAFSDLTDEKTSYLVAGLGFCAYTPYRPRISEKESALGVEIRDKIREALPVERCESVLHHLLAPMEGRQLGLASHAAIVYGIGRLMKKGGEFELTPSAAVFDLIHPFLSCHDMGGNHVANDVRSLSQLLLGFKDIMDLLVDGDSAIFIREHGGPKIIGIHDSRDEMFAGKVMAVVDTIVEAVPVLAAYFSSYCDRAILVRNGDASPLVAGEGAVNAMLSLYTILRYLPGEDGDPTFDREQFLHIRLAVEKSVRLLAMDSTRMITNELAVGNALKTLVWFHKEGMLTPIEMPTLRKAIHGIVAKWATIILRDRYVPKIDDRAVLQLFRNVLECAGYGFLETDADGHFKANETGLLLRDVLRRSLQSLSDEVLLKTADERIFPDILIALILSKQLERRIPWVSDDSGEESFSSEIDDAMPQRGSKRNGARLPDSPHCFHDAVIATFDAYLHAFGKVTMDEGLEAEIRLLFQKLEHVSASAPRLARFFFTKTAIENEAIGKILKENELLATLQEIGVYPDIEVSFPVNNVLLNLPKDKRVGSVSIVGNPAVPLHLPSLSDFDHCSGIQCRCVTISNLFVSPSAMAGHLDSPIQSEMLSFCRTSPITVDHVSVISGWMDLSVLKKVTMVETAFGSFGLERLFILAPNLNHLRLENTHISSDQLNVVFAQRPETLVFLEMINCTSDIEFSRWSDYQADARDCGFVIR